MLFLTEHGISANCPFVSARFSARFFAAAISQNPVSTVAKITSRRGPAPHLMDGMGGYAGRSKAVAKPCPNVGNGTTGPIGSRFRPRWTYFRARKSAQNSPLAISLFLAAARMASERRSGGTVTHEIVASPSS